jgi:hypothetical protein
MPNMWARMPLLEVARPQGSASGSNSHRWAAFTYHDRECGTMGRETEKMRRAADAKELLELEKLYQEGKLDEKGSERWNELATSIFADHRPHARRSFRLPAGATAQVAIRNGTFTCTIVEISRLGMTLQGTVFAHITHEDSIRVCGVTFDGKERRVDLHCDIVHFDEKKSPFAVGVSISEENSRAAKDGFFTQVYYPMYLKYLEHLASRNG